MLIATAGHSRRLSVTPEGGSFSRPSRCVAALIVKTISGCLGTFLAFVFVSCAHAAQTQTKPEVKGRIGNWYYISGTDQMFHVPRFVAAVHDSQARMSLIFTCQGRPGVAPGANAKPMMSMILSDPIGRPGDKTRIKMRLDETSLFATKWITTANRETRLDDSDPADPLQLLFRIAGNNHRWLMMELQRKQVQFDLDGARAVLFLMLDTCVKPAKSRDAKARKRR
jgi:hypothetical protein